MSNCSDESWTKPMLTLPDDREKLTSLDLTLRNIISYESDRDVRKVINTRLDYKRLEDPINNPFRT